MKQARLYEQPQEFADMMMRHLTTSLNLQVNQKVDEPLLLEYRLGSGANEEKAEISLHDPYRTYLAGEDLNTAIDYLNDVIRTAQFIQSFKDHCHLDPEYIYPAIRDVRYVEEGSRDSRIISDPCLPGLRVVYLEIKDGVTKLINRSLLDQNPKLSGEKVRKLAYANLRAEGWQEPQMSLKVPFRETCTVDVFLENPYPIECQFFLPEWKPLLPKSYFITFTNRMSLMMMHTTERLDSMERATQLLEKTRFEEVVKRSYYIMPSPVSQNIYWVHNGKAQLLKV